MTRVELGSEESYAALEEAWRRRTIAYSERVDAPRHGTMLRIITDDHAHDVQEFFVSDLEWVRRGNGDPLCRQIHADLRREHHVYADSRIAPAIRNAAFWAMAEDRIAPAPSSQVTGQEPEPLVSPHQAAWALIRDSVPPAVIEDLARDGYTEIPSGSDRHRKYRIHRAPNVRRTEVWRRKDEDSSWRIERELCVELAIEESYPHGDLFLAHYLWLSTDEDGFLTRANHFAPRAAHDEINAPYPGFVSTTAYRLMPHEEMLVDAHHPLTTVYNPAPYNEMPVDSFNPTHINRTLARDTAELLLSAPGISEYLRAQLRRYLEEP